MFASILGHAQVVKLLCSRGADKDACTASGDTALMLAAAANTERLTENAEMLKAQRHLSEMHLWVQWHRELEDLVERKADLSFELVQGLLCRVGRTAVL